MTFEDKILGLAAGFREFSDLRKAELTAEERFNFENMINSGNLLRQLAAAKHPDLPPDLMEEMANSNNPAMQHSLLDNPHLSHSAMRIMYHNQSVYGEFRSYLARRPDLPLDLMEEMARSVTTNTLGGLAKNPNLSEKAMEILATGQDAGAEYLAQRYEIPVNIAETLANREGWKTRALLAHNPLLHSALVDKLSRDPNGVVRDNIANRMDLSISTIDRLSRDPETVLTIAGNNKIDLPNEVVTRLATYKEKNVRRRLANRMDLPKPVVESLLSDNDEIVRSKAESHKIWHGMGDAGQSVSTKLGTHKLRKVRDQILESGKTEEHPKNLPPGDYSRFRTPGGNVSTEKIQQHIDDLPTHDFQYTYGKWTGVQRHSQEPSKVFQLNLSDNQLQQLRQAGVMGTFRKMWEASHTSQHPVGPRGVGWVRFTGSKKDGIHIDEIQSDLGQSFVKQAAQQAKAQGQDSIEAAQKAEVEYPEGHYQKIKEIVFGGKHPNEVLHESFLQHLRDRGYHKTPVHIWTPESKAPISSMNISQQLPGHMLNTYGEMPKKMGYTPQKYGELPTQKNPDHEEKSTLGDKVRKSEEYEGLKEHMNPETRAHFEALPKEHRDYFARQMYFDTLQPLVGNKLAYQEFQSRPHEGVHVLLDFNHFKSINDTMSYQHGDDAIRDGFGALSNASRANKGKLFRVGGDEGRAYFDTPEQAHMFLRHADENFRKLVPVGGTHKLSFSAGIGSNPEEAEHAMHAAKEKHVAKYGDVRSGTAQVGHGENFFHSLLPGAVNSEK